MVKLVTFDPWPWSLFSYVLFTVHISSTVRSFECLNLATSFSVPCIFRIFRSSLSFKVMELMSRSRSLQQKCGRAQVCASLGHGLIYDSSHPQYVDEAFVTWFSNIFELVQQRNHMFWRSSRNMACLQSFDTLPGGLPASKNSSSSLKEDSKEDKVRKQQETSTPYEAYEDVEISLCPASQRRLCVEHQGMSGPRTFIATGERYEMVSRTGKDLHFWVCFSSVWVLHRDVRYQIGIFTLWLEAEFTGYRILTWRTTRHIDNWAESTTPSEWALSSSGRRQY